MPQTFVVPADGSSVPAKDFAKAADEALKAHQKTLTDDQRRDLKAEQELHDVALEAAKALVKNKAFGDAHVYAVVSSGRNDNAWPQGSGTIIDIRVESRAKPAAGPSAAQQAAEAQRILDESRRRDLQEAARAQSVSSGFPSGERAEETAARRDISTPQHTIVPPSTGSSPYMPGNTPEQLAAAHDPATLPQGNPEETEKLARRQGGKRSTGGRRSKASRAKAAASRRAQRKAAKENAETAKMVATRKAGPAGKAAVEGAQSSAPKSNA